MGYDAEKNGLGFIAALITGATALTSTIISAVSKRKERKAAEKMQEEMLEYEQQQQEQAIIDAQDAERQAKLAAQKQRAEERKQKIAYELPILRSQYEQQKQKTKRNTIIALVAGGLFVTALITGNKKKRK